MRTCYGFLVECSVHPDATYVPELFFGPEPVGGPDQVTSSGPVVRITIDVAEDAGGPVIEPPYFPENWEHADEITIDVGRSSAVVDPVAWTVRVSLARADLPDQIVWGRWVLERAFVYLVCRSPRHYPLHAGGVSVNGRTAVVTADSGVGKSTFTAWALRSGADFAGEDILVRHMDDPSGTFWGYPRVTYLSPELLEMWPQLDRALSAPVPNRNKSRVILPKPFEPRMRPGSEPYCLLFLTRGDGELRPVDADDAIERCRSDFATGKLGPSVEADVEKDLRRQLDGMPVWELALSADLEANYQTVVSAMTAEPGAGGR